MSLPRFVILLACLGAAHAGPLDRGAQPLVLEGAQLPDLLGRNPARLVAFRYEAGWVQVPLQVDERAEIDFGTLYGQEPTPADTLLTYADSGTFGGADPDGTFDADDELVLMLRDAGGPRGHAQPPGGTLAGSGVELTVDDPLDGARAFFYLYEQDGSLDPAAGVDLVQYAFVLEAGDYKQHYATETGPNPESSFAAGDNYEVDFSDRWIRHRTRITAGSGVDLLDRHRSLFAPGNCGRSEDTFSAGPGAFIVNRDGPLRALRGYLGANSGPTTYRIHRFYETSEQIETVLRVHPIPGLLDVFDYEPAASGMRYRRDLDAAGVPVDGKPDVPAAGLLAWEMWSGAQGTLAHSWRIDTDIPGFASGSFYSDDEEPEDKQCTGDDEEWGAAGLRVADSIPNTDPNDPTQPAFELSTWRTILYGPPNRRPAFAERHDRRTRIAVSTTTRAIAQCADADADGFVDCAGCDLPAGAACGDCDPLAPACGADCTDRRGDGVIDCSADDVVVHFDLERGVWRHDGDDWSKLSGWHADGLAAFAQSVAVDFGERGVWSYDSSGWQQLWAEDVQQLHGWSGGLLADRAADGLWLQDPSGWQRIDDRDPKRLLPWGDRILAGFGRGKGLWVWEQGDWWQLSEQGTNAVTTWGNERAAANFNWGLARWDAVEGWRRISYWYAEALDARGDDLIVDFGDRGLWSFGDTSGWRRLTTWNPEAIAVWGGRVVADFGAAHGLWLHDGIDWRRLSTWDARRVEPGGSLVAIDFGERGLWAWRDGSGWRRLSTWTSDRHVTADID